MGRRFVSLRFQSHCALSEILTREQVLRAIEKDAAVPKSSKKPKPADADTSSEKTPASQAEAIEKERQPSLETVKTEKKTTSNFGNFF